MDKYVLLVRAVMTQFDECHVEHILREENAKADALSKFASSEIEKFRYGIPRILVTDNGTQFNNEEFRKYWQAEVANRIILDGLKKRIEKSRNNWVDKILPTLWTYRTTCRVTTGATPFMLAYGAEAVVPVEISHSSPRIQAYNAEEDEEGQRLALDLIDKV
ncbi:uncharacterized protein LOC141695458 [Apium graveolens]|uniref:uncharacterized protein LOC141695458 n=1 Tax=Apium graveolens TaxID=4045 RepID=UPI003D7BA5B1